MASIAMALGFLVDTNCSELATNKGCSLPVSSQAHDEDAEESVGQKIE
jgi:hypothetical protein